MIKNLYENDLGYMIGTVYSTVLGYEIEVMYTKDISEIIVDGDQAYKSAREFVKILSPHNLKKIKENKRGELPLFQENRECLGLPGA